MQPPPIARLHAARFRTVMLTSIGCCHMNARDGVPLLGRPRGGVGGRSSLIDYSSNTVSACEEQRTAGHRQPASLVL